MDCEIDNPTEWYNNGRDKAMRIENRQPKRVAAPTICPMARNERTPPRESKAAAIRPSFDKYWHTKGGGLKQHISPVLLFVFGMLLLLCGCCQVTRYKQNVLEKKLINRYGLPDFLSEISGDSERSYKYGQVPEDKWPASSIVTYYFLSQNKEVVTCRGVIKGCSQIDDERKSKVLIPLLQRLRNADD